MLRQFTRMPRLFVALCFAITFMACQKETSLLKNDNEQASGKFASLVNRVKKVTFYDTLNGNLYSYRRYSYSPLNQVTAIHVYESWFGPDERNYFIFYDQERRVDSIQLDLPGANLTGWKYYYDPTGQLEKVVNNYTNGGTYDTLLFDYKPVTPGNWFPKPTFRAHAITDYRNIYYAYDMNGVLEEVDVSSFTNYREVQHHFVNSPYANPEYAFYKISKMQDLQIMDWPIPPALNEQLAGATLPAQHTYTSYNTEKPVEFSYTFRLDNRQRVTKVYQLKEDGSKLLIREYEY